MGNKLALEIRLIEDTGLEITFLHWDNRFLSDYNEERVGEDIKFVYFESQDTEFCMYSQDTGYIIDDCQFVLVVPDVDNMKHGVVLKHIFRSDDVRYRFLKAMYDYLPEWANTWESFKNDEKGLNFIIHNQFWVY